VPGATLTLTVAGVEVCGFTVTVAEAFESSLAALLAVTVTYEGVETLGAVSTPVLDIKPAVVDQRTDVLVVPLTDAENCCAAPDITVALVGFTFTVIVVDTGGFTVTVAEALEEADAALVAVTVT
jgi:hypothetical protein